MSHACGLVDDDVVFFSGLVMFLSCESPSSNRANYKYIYIYIHTYYIYIYIYIIHRPSFTSKRRCLFQHVPVFANVWTTLRVRYMCFVCYQIKHWKRWIYVCLCCIMYVVLFTTSFQPSPTYKCCCHSGTDGSFVQHYRWVVLCCDAQTYKSAA